MNEPRLPTHDLPERIGEAVAAVRARTSLLPRVGITLGSGLSALMDAVEDAVSITTAELPHWPRSTVTGHAGRLVLGMWRGVPVVVQAGRNHRYEGLSLDRATFGVRVQHGLGARSLIFTNAAGGVAAGLVPGNLMLATDHVNFIGKRGLFTPAELKERRWGRRVAACHDPGLGEALARAAEASGVPLRRGILMGIHGPSYESAAEIRFARGLGVGAVCMSTVHEVTLAAHLGCRAASLSTITNLATGLSAARLTHHEVTEGAHEGSTRLRALIEAFLDGERGATADAAR